MGHKFLCVTSLSIALLTHFVDHAMSQEFEPNYDESRVPEYDLPDPLTTHDGDGVTDAETWRSTRRPELLELFKQHVFGSMPPALPIARADVHETDRSALGGDAVRRQVTLYFHEDGSGPAIHLLVYAPKSDEPVPAFLGYNFWGNHTVHPDRGIRITPYWDRKPGDEPTLRPESSRGENQSRWQVEKIVDRGYAVATVYYGDVDPDFFDGFENGVHALYPDYQDRPDNWTSIGAWAWGLSRVLDYLATDDLIDAERVAVIGHSRLGKTSLWTGATDERFSIVISNNSGCGGAALARRRYGETVARINTVFPHWFCARHKEYNDNEAAMPVDHHELIALIAPRPVYVASAVEDRWADPRGEFLSCLGANPVYRLLDTEGLPATEWPAVDKPTQGRIGYHVRSGGHDVTAYDWEQYLDFVDRHWQSLR